MISLCVNLFVIFLAIFITIKTFSGVYKEYKRIDDDIFKIIYILLIIIILFPVVLYYLDRYNLLSKFTFTKNIDPNSWLGFIGTYSSGIITVFLSSCITVYITVQQINRTYEDNKILNLESNRIQNLPLLKYSFEEYNNKINSYEKLLKSNTKGNNDALFIMRMKNIGLNNIRDKKIYIRCNDLGIDEVIRIDNCSPLEKSVEECITFIIPQIMNGNYCLKIKVVYEDLLKNWYEQDIDLTLEITDIHIRNHRYVGCDAKVSEESIIDKCDKRLINMGF